MYDEQNKKRTGLIEQKLQKPKVMMIVFLLYTTFATDVDKLVH